MSGEIAVEGLPIDVSFVGDLDPTNWRDMKDPDPNDLFENDEDHSTPKDVVNVLGFDPDNEKW